MTHTEPPPALDAPAAAEPRCPACLSLHRPGQTYCLECGARLAEEPGPAAAGERPRREPDARAAAWPSRWPSSLLIAHRHVHRVGLHARRRAPRRPARRRPAALHPAARRRDGPDRADHDADRTRRSRRDGHGATVPTGSGETIPTFSEDLPSTDETEPPATTEEPPLDEEPIDEWPAGLDGWATILISKEVDDFDNAYMEDLRSDAQARGLTDLGILYSSDWSTLNPGFRVLYQGPFDTRDEANRAAVAAQGNGYEFAYPRHVAP